MRAICLVPDTALSLLLLWALLVCLCNIGAGVIAFFQRRYRIGIAAILSFAPIYFLWQVLFDLYLSRKTGNAVTLTRQLGALPFIVWLFAFAVLGATAITLFLNCYLYSKKSITPSAVKLCLDQMSSGICCWRDNGRVLFSNHCMNRLCVALTDEVLLNGNHFRAAVTEPILTIDGKVWRFHYREIAFESENLHEMVASDITNEYAKTKALESDKAELSRLNEELKEYNLSIDDTVRRQEILQAKINIHDEMNRLMLSTMAAEQEDSQALERIFSLWEQNALLLCLETEEKSDQKALEGLQEMAQALGVQLLWQNPLPAVLDERQKELFFSTAGEAVINAVKHAAATEMRISYVQTPETIHCIFTNNGTLPEAQVRFAGGLANLSVLAAEQGAALQVEANERFSLHLIFPIAD